MKNIKLYLYDEKNEFSTGLTEKLIQKGFVLQSLSLDQMITAVAKSPPDVALFNQSAETPSELLDLIQEIRTLEEHLPLVVLTPKADVSTAVQYMKAGVTDFRLLPADWEELETSLRRSVEVFQLARKVFQMEAKQNIKGDFFGIIGQSPKMQANFKSITQVAKTNATVLIQGESGTGKELVAKAIHILSGRKKDKFIDLNCGAIPRELLENELFGHERGAFTGAERRYLGSFERADGGTLFLDEIGEMELPLQVKILRVLQEKSFQRVGGVEKISVSVRVVTATNRNLKKEVEEGRFREDLFYRLNVVPITLPPLRERTEDVPLLARHFLNLYSLKNNKIFLDFHPEAMEAFINYPWPGNVRELENTIERIVVLCNDSQVKLKHLPENLQKAQRQVIAATTAGDPLATGAGGEIIPLEELERIAIDRAIRQCNGNVLEAAQQLKVGQATLYRKIRKFGIQK